jgi:short-subunit dehydrogenase
LFAVPSLSEALQPFSTVIVTGGSSGIGKSFIKLGGKLEASPLFCNLSRRSPGENIFPNAPERLNHFSCDLARAEEIERVAGELERFLAQRAPTGRILLINNSGIGAFGRFPEPNLGRELEVVDVNIRAVVHLTGRLLPLLKTRGGAIMNIASTMAYQPTPYSATYGASKAFVLNWTLALNEELRGTDLRALAVCPGTTLTEFFRVAGLGDGAILASFAMTSDEVAEVALRALAAGKKQVVPGWKNKIYTFAGARVAKPLAARIAAALLGRLRLKPARP